MYDLLLAADRTPVVKLNRAAAVREHAKPEAGLTLMDELLERGELRDYQFWQSARTDFLRRFGCHDEARTAYRWALELTTQEPERRSLEPRLRELRKVVEDVGREHLLKVGECDDGYRCLSKQCYSSPYDTVRGKRRFTHIQLGALAGAPT